MYFTSMLVLTIKSLDCFDPSFVTVKMSICSKINYLCKLGVHFILTPVISSWTLISSWTSPRDARSSSLPYY